MCTVCKNKFLVFEDDRIFFSLFKFGVNWLVEIDHLRGGKFDCFEMKWNLFNDFGFFVPLMLYTPYRFIFNLHLEVSANQHTIYPPIRPQSKLFFRSDLTLSLTHAHTLSWLWANERSDRERMCANERARKREGERERARENGKNRKWLLLSQTV